MTIRGPGALAHQPRHGRDGLGGVRRRSARLAADPIAAGDRAHRRRRLQHGRRRSSATAVEYDLPAVWVILNNYELGIERKGVERTFKRSHPWYTFTRKDTGEPYNPDYVMLARAYGAEGVRIEDPAELGPRARRGDPLEASRG